MSGVGSRTISGSPPSFLILPGSATLGRKSATAAAITTTSAADANCSTAACISRGSLDCDHNGTWRGGQFDRRDERHRGTERKRLGGDRVALLAAAAVGDHSHCVDRLACATGGHDERADRGGRHRRAHAPPRRRSARVRPDGPCPTSPPASRPSSGSTMCTPRRRSVAMLSVTAGCSHISVCIAGHTITGARVASRTLVNRSVESPAAYAPIRRAVAGATITRSAD